MAGRIFLLDGRSELTPMEEAPYLSEDVLQKMLADHLDLLPGDQIGTKEPCRWLLVRREMPVPDRLDGGGRWSLDHLFLDHRGIPTLVEVKRSSDTRARREVVAQMLDYAANAVVHWPVNDLINSFEKRCENDNRNAAEVLEEFLGEVSSAGEFWDEVKTNLQAGRIRLIFVADIISSELTRIVEFLNEQMDPAEVLAVEIRQYAGGEHRMIVPRVLGQTEASKARKSATSPAASKEWDEASFETAIADRLDPKEREVIESVRAWISERPFSIHFGKGGKDGSLSAKIKEHGDLITFISLYTRPNLTIPFHSLKKSYAFQSEGDRKEFYDRLIALPGIHPKGKGPDGGDFPISYESLAEEDVFKGFVDILCWAWDRFITKNETDKINVSEAAAASSGVS